MTSEKKATLWQLFWSFLKIGLFTFGGGYAMLPLIEREFSISRGWIDKKEFMELLTLAQSAPGPIALNTSVFVGYRMAGYAGAVAALLGIVLPSFVIILVIAIFLREYKNDPNVVAVMKGLLPAVVALIAAPLLRLARGMGIVRLVIAAAVALMVWKLPVSPAYYIAAGAAGGILYMLWRSRKGAER